MKVRVRELDYLRVFSMLAVIMIHVSSSYIFAESNFVFFGMNFAFILNQASRFAVPSFVFISGAALGLKEENGGYFRQALPRSVKLLIPYIIWCALYCAKRGEPISPAGFAYGLLTGNFASHLYFSIVILQMYLLAPLLRKLLRKYSGWTITAAAAISLYTQTAIDLGGKAQLVLLPLPFRGLMWELFPVWILFFVLGLYLAPKMTCLKTLRLRPGFLALAPALIAAGGVFYAFTRRAEGYKDSINPLIMGYWALVTVCITAPSSWLGRFKRLNKTVEFLALRSMTVYFCHVLILKDLRDTGFFVQGMSGMAMLYIAVTVLSVAAAVLIDGAVAFIRKKVIFPDKHSA